MSKVSALLLVLAAAGCAVPRPTLFKAATPPPADAIADPFARHKAGLAAALRHYYPRLVQHGDGGAATVLFVTTPDGRIERTDLLRGRAAATTEALFRRFADLRDDPARPLAGVTRFEPGELGPDTIVVVWAARGAGGGRQP
jgi:hypothetical protein